MILWHEMAHHVFEDARELKGEDQDSACHNYIRNRAPEEGFCELTAFKTAEKGIPLPKNVAIAILLDPSSNKIGGISRRIAIENLYVRWNRQNDPIYRPVAHPEIARKYGNLWSQLWLSHEQGETVINVPTEIYEELHYSWSRLGSKKEGSLRVISPLGGGGFNSILSFQE